MSKNKVTVDVLLNTPIEIDISGQPSQAKLVTLIAASPKFSAQLIRLKQYLIKANNDQEFKAVKMMEHAIRAKAMAEREGIPFGEQEEEEKKTTPDEMITLLLSADFDATELIDAFKKLLGMGQSIDSCVAQIEGKEVLTPYIFDLMDFNDQLNLLGTYYANFIITGLGAKAS